MWLPQAESKYPCNSTYDKNLYETKKSEINSSKLSHPPPELPRAPTLRWARIPVQMKQAHSYSIENTITEQQYKNKLCFVHSRLYTSCCPTLYISKFDWLHRIIILCVWIHFYGIKAILQGRMDKGSRPSPETATESFLSLPDLPQPPHCYLHCS